MYKTYQEPTSLPGRLPLQSSSARMSPTLSRLSVLESLPNELIHQIHLESLEVNLARASLTISRAVSTESIFSRFVIQAFWNDPQQCFRDPHFHRNSAYTDLPFERFNYTQYDIFKKNFGHIPYQDLKIDVQKRLQKDVLSCRWFSIRRLERAFPILLAMTMSTTHYQFALVAHMSADDLPDGRLPCILSSSTPGSGTELSCCLRNDRSEKKLDIIDSLTVQATYHNPVHGRPHLFRTLRVFHIPEKILSGPWTEEQKQMLMLLRRGFGKRFKWHEKTHWTSSQRFLAPSFSEAACMEGIQRAIHAQDHQILRYLLDFLQSLSSCAHAFQQQPELPTSFFVMAIEHCPDRPIFLRLLIQANGNKLPFHDSLRRWAFDQSEQDELAKAVRIYYLLQGPHLRNRFVKVTHCLERRIPPIGRWFCRPHARRSHSLDVPWSRESLLDTELWL